MTPHTLTIITNILFVAGGLFSLLGIYYAFFAFIGLKRQKNAPIALPATRFAVVIAARNEEAVIGNLVDSLAAQHYPKGLYDIIVAPNNCTDDTRGVALAHGAKIFTPKGPIRSKGEVLHQAVRWLEDKGGYDALCVFDADNLAHPDFLQKMNDAIQNGAQAVQGFRDSKNPADSAVATCYSVGYWMLNRFYNAGRQKMRLSSLIHGCGFALTMPLLKKMGGWNTRTMTEDYEMTAQCLLAGQRVHYVADAVFYDEQPLTFRQSWKQRRRWTTGYLQGMELYLRALVQQGVKRRSWALLDLAITFTMPITQLVSLLLGGATAVVLMYQVFGLHLLPVLQAGLLALLAAVGAFLVFCGLAAFIIYLCRGRVIRGTGKGIAAFALFTLSWLPISLISMVKRQTKWDAIAHTRSVSIRDMAA